MLSTASTSGVHYNTSTWQALTNAKSGEAISNSLSSKQVIKSTDSSSIFAGITGLKISGSALTSSTPMVFTTGGPVGFGIKVGGGANWFKYESAMWGVKILLPVCLLLQTLGHILIWRLSLSRRRCESRILVTNYIVCDSIFLIYTIVSFSVDVMNCAFTQGLHQSAVTLPMYAVALITLKRYIKVLKPLHAASMVTARRELGMVAASWIVVEASAGVSFAGVCQMKKHIDISYCYFSEISQERCLAVIVGNFACF